MSKLFIYNNLTKRKELFEPVNHPIINIYTCGPTVYDHSHIGHARSAITWDFIVRFLRMLDYKVIWTRNITDIDDKIINKAKEINIHPDKVARMFTYSFHEDMEALGVEWPDYEPRATQYLPQMIDFIDSLIKKGCAYEIDNDVYFSINSFKNYGKLKGQIIADLESGFGRIEPNPRKKHPLDFALWKNVKNKNEYSFKSPWGLGRPGWHIECSTMNYAIYSETIDIHGGGDDLIFPHHENEIAQSESFSGKLFSKYWLHNGMIMIDGKKMAKSEGNFITIKDALKQTTGNALRLFTLNTHYKMPLNYTQEAIRAAQNGLYRIKEAISDVNPHEITTNSKEKELTCDYINEFKLVMCDDFNSPQALAIIFKLVDKINSEKNSKLKQDYQKTLCYLLSTLGFNLKNIDIDISTKDKTLSKLIIEMIKLRNDLKKIKNYETADKLREILSDCNIEVKDLANDQYKWQIKI